MKRWLKILIGVIALGAIVMAKLPKGIRNNNPGNIRKSNDAWEGLSARHDDGQFFIFNNPFWGLRALARILSNYRARHGITTIRGIIERYAPGTENDTEAYIAAVSKRTGIGPEQPFVIDASLDLLLPAIVRHEIGFNPFTDNFIGRAIVASRA